MPLGDVDSLHWILSIWKCSVYFASLITSYNQFHIFICLYIPSYIWAYWGNPASFNHRHASTASISKSVVRKKYLVSGFFYHLNMILSPGCRKYNHTICLLNIRFLFLFCISIWGSRNLQKSTYRMFSLCWKMRINHYTE